MDADRRQVLAAAIATDLTRALTHDERIAGWRTQVEKQLRGLTSMLHWFIVDYAIFTEEEEETP
jgi:hypothetical protein